MIALAPEASRQVEELESFYARRQRPLAIRNLGYAWAEASLIIMDDPERGLTAPRSYPDLAVLELRWVKRGRYWIAYDQLVRSSPGVLFETGDIPARFSRD